MSSDAALLELLRRLQALNYHFVAVTPATHARVIARPLTGPPTLRDIFGWSRQFQVSDLHPELFALLEQASALEPCEGKLRSKVRVAALGDRLFLHSRFPTSEQDSVFFGPDTYRFAAFVQDATRELRAAPASIVDMGAGSGAGGIVAASRFPVAEVTLVDINPEALRLAAINAAAARVEVRAMQGDEMPAADLVLANPPYIMDPARRAYRDGGDLLGGGVAAMWARQALERLTPGGTLLLYTGAAVTGGRAPLADALRQACATAGAELTIRELDPDVFGEELEQPAYAEVERIAAIGAVIRVSE